MLTDTNATRAFLAHLLDGRPVERVVLCCERLTGRRLLRRWGGDDVVIFAMTADAVRYAFRNVGAGSDVPDGPAAIALVPRQSGGGGDPPDPPVHA